MYIAGSLTASLSHNLGVFILGWCLIQGFGAALMLPNVQTIIREYRSGESRAKAYGAMAGVNALGAAMGPVIGGFLTTYFSWRWAFRLEVISLLIIVIFNRFIPKDKTIKNPEKIDFKGLTLQAGAMISSVLGILLISDFGLISPTVVSLISIGAVLLILFVRTENRNVQNKKPSLVQMALFKIKDFVSGLKVRSIQVSVFAGVLFTVPLFMQVTYGISAFETENRNVQNKQCTNFTQ